MAGISSFFKLMYCALVLIMLNWPKFDEILGNDEAFSLRPENEIFSLTFRQRLLWSIQTTSGTSSNPRHLLFMTELIRANDADFYANFYADFYANNSAANELSDIFKYYLSSFYYGGMFAVCMSGLQAVVADEDLEQSLKFMGVLAGELVAIGLATVVSEEIIEGFEDVRTSIYNTRWYEFSKFNNKRLHLMTTMSNYRGLRTVFGYELTLMHFGNVLNASYKYYNLLLLTMK